jgi:hypothetical protein
MKVPGRFKACTKTLFKDPIKSVSQEACVFVPFSHIHISQIFKMADADH